MRRETRFRHRLSQLELFGLFGVVLRNSFVDVDGHRFVAFEKTRAGSAECKRSLEKSTASQPMSEPVCAKRVNCAVRFAASAPACPPVVQR